jgi:ammonia channel protein AmtB
MISTGSLGERAKLEPLVGFMVVLQTIIYPVIMSWAWNLQGGFLRNLGYFDRGGSVIIFETGAIAGLIGAVVVGPRYTKGLKKADVERMLGGGKENRKKPLITLLGIHLEDSIDVDDLYLRKVRKLIKKEGDENDYHKVHVPMMVLGTFIIVIGWSLLIACGYGTHSLNSVDGRYAAEVAFMNSFISGSFCGFISFLLKRHVTRENHKIPRYDVKSICNGYLSGMAAVSAGAGVMKPWSALVTGVI